MLLSRNITACNELILTLFVHVYIYIYIYIYMYQPVSLPGQWRPGRCYPCVERTGQCPPPHLHWTQRFCFCELESVLFLDFCYMFSNSLNNLYIHVHVDVIETTFICLLCCCRVWCSRRDVTSCLAAPSTELSKSGTSMKCHTLKRCE